MDNKLIAEAFEKVSEVAKMHHEAIREMIVRLDEIERKLKGYKMEKQAIKLKKEIEQSEKVNIIIDES